MAAELELDQVLVNRADLGFVLDPSRQPLWPSGAHAAAVARLRSAIDDPPVPPPSGPDWGPLAGPLAVYAEVEAALGPDETARFDQFQEWARRAIALMGIDITDPVELHRFLVALVFVTCTAQGEYEHGGLDAAACLVIAAHTRSLASVLCRWLPAGAR